MVPNDPNPLLISFEWFPVIIKAFGQIFFEVGGISRNGFAYRWVYILGDDKEACNYFYQATIKNENGDEWSFKGLFYDIYIRDLINQNFQFKK